MSKMDFRYYNTDSKQWEKTVVSPEDILPLTTDVDSLEKRFPEKFIETVDNWDDVVIGGMYLGDGDTINHPEDYTAFLIGMYYAIDENRGTLILNSLYTDDHQYVRHKRGGVWAPWDKRPSTKAFEVVQHATTDLESRYGTNAKTITDWDSITESGLYMAINGLNAPIAGDWVVGEYIAHDASWGQVRVYLLGVLQSHTISYIRNKTAGTWGPWRRDIEEGDLVADNISTPAVSIYPQSNLTTLLASVAGNIYPVYSRNAGTAYYYTNLEVEYPATYFLEYSYNPVGSGNPYYRGFCAGYISVRTDHNQDEGTYVTITYSEVVNIPGPWGTTVTIVPEFVSLDNTKSASKVTDPENWRLRVLVNGFTPGYEGSYSTFILRKVGN